MADAADKPDLSPVHNTTLTEKDLPKILNNLCDIADKWEELANFLPNLSNKSKADVKAMHGEASTKLFHIMKRWLDEAEPTLKDLLDALRSRFLSENRIAHEIEQKFQEMYVSKPPLQTSVSFPANNGQSKNRSTPFNRYDSESVKLTIERNPQTDNISTDARRHDCDQVSTSVVQECHATEQVPSSSNSNNTNSQLAYECCCDEKCSITEIVSGECPNPKDTSSHFPYLAAKYLDDDDRDMLCGHLQIQFSEISMNYAVFRSSVRESLTQRKVTPATLTATLMDLPAYSSHTNKVALLEDRFIEMKKADSLDDVFYILKDYDSVFNHDIIGYIVKKLGTNEDKQNLKKYEEDFAEYCKRNIFECPMPSRSKKPSKFANLVLKVESEIKYTLKAIQMFRAQVAKILHITKHTLKLANVQDGCFQVTFQFPRFLKTHMFPLRCDQKKDLRDLNVVSLECDGVPQPLTPSKSDDAHTESLGQGLAVDPEAIEMDPMSADTAASKADDLLQQQKYSDAVKYSSLALSLDKNCARAYFTRALANNKVGKLEEAIEDFQYTLKFDPRNMKANTLLARLQGELRRRTKQKHEMIIQKAKKCDLPPLEGEKDIQFDVCEIPPPKPLQELDIVQFLEEWEMSLRALVGEEVLVSSTLSSKVPVSIFETEGSVIGLYFSGIWCPPSGVFTPQLIDWYKNFKKGPNGHLLDIIFVSSDEDEKSWRDYSSEMPWYGVDYKDEVRQRKLYTKYNVTGIPSLIFVEGNTGKVINREGRSVVLNDPRGEGFPWKQKSFSEIIVDAKFVDRNKREIVWAWLQGKIIGLFFSAYWCDPGIEFTFKLIPLYEKLRQGRQNFEIIYVNFDKKEEEWQMYCGLMPWISLPFEDEHIDSLRKLYDVQDIPTLIVIDDQGRKITAEGFNYVNSDPECMNFPWYVNTLTEFNPEDFIESEVARLIWFLPSNLMVKAKEVLEPLAKCYISRVAEKNMEMKLLFFTAQEGNEPSEDVRKFARLTQPAPLLVIVDMAHKQVHVSDSSDVTEENARRFVYDFLQKRLMGKKLVL